MAERNGNHEALALRYVGRVPRAATGDVASPLGHMGRQAGSRSCGRGPHRSISRRIGWIARGFGHWVGAKLVFSGRSLVESAHDRGRRVVWGALGKACG